MQCPFVKKACVETPQKLSGSGYVDSELTPLRVKGSESMDGTEATIVACSVRKELRMMILPAFRLRIAIMPVNP